MDTFCSLHLSTNNLFHFHLVNANASLNKLDNWTLKKTTDNPLFILFKFKIQLLVQPDLYLYNSWRQETESKAASLILSTNSFENDGCDTIKYLAKVGKGKDTQSERIIIWLFIIF